MTREYRRIALLCVLALLSVVPLAVGIAAAAEACRFCFGAGSCRTCGGEGRLVCSGCNGRRQFTASWLSDAKREVTCGLCNGTGRRACYMCVGGGRCRHCVGGVVYGATTPAMPSSPSSSSSSAGSSVSSSDRRKQALALAALKLEANGVTAKITQVRSLHGVQRNGRRGMFVVIDFEVFNAKGVDGQIDVRFESAQGEPLSDIDGQFSNADGEVITSDTFRPAHAHARWRKANLFMPYDQLHLPRGRHQLRCVAQASLSVDGLSIPIEISEPHEFFTWRN